MESSLASSSDNKRC
uniref:Uncharacterized protein n=1 Tax=Anguilla anguilla TaxID=7936 RepID=A0A0E9QCQ3_ANGAN